MSQFVSNYKKRIQKKEIKIGVVGLGYVGLPLALEFAKKKVNVLGIEIDKDRLSQIENGVSYITDVTTKELKHILKAGYFEASGDFEQLKAADAVIICVPTPLKRKYHPNISYIKEAVKEISKNIKKGALVILESTTYPGTTDEVILPLLENAGLIHNKDFFLCFSPERIDPGNVSFPVNKIPKIVGGISKEATELAALTYGIIIDKIVKVSSARSAEAAKLLENTFRLINIGMIDELAMMANKMNIDIWEVIDAAKTKPFGFMPFYPGPGVGGHCIPKDPLYLYWKAKHFGFRSKFIKLASDVISRMPEYVVERVEEVLEKQGCEIKNAKILVVGVTYKKDIKDLRKSPPLDIISTLQKKKSGVSYYDPLVTYLKIGHIDLGSISLSAEKLADFDCVIIATDHTSTDYKFILKHAKLIFDTRNIYKGIEDRKVIRL
ncbi:MAG: nucleotide sugar dehydrogenase [Candidatus Omnitrophica bacterium]|nr:nucleotide sugar dehydrogenase [Candidatus Omnitrophota bacterium]